VIAAGPRYDLVSIDGKRDWRGTQLLGAQSASCPAGEWITSWFRSFGAMASGLPQTKRKTQPPRRKHRRC